MSVLGQVCAIFSYWYRSGLVISMYICLGFPRGVIHVDVSAGTNEQQLY